MQGFADHDLSEQRRRDPFDNVESRFTFVSAVSWSVVFLYDVYKIESDNSPLISRLKCDWKK